MVGAIFDEISVATNQFVGSVLWDMEKFYDNIDIVKLVRFATRLSYPVRLKALGLIMHMAPRLIRAGESYAYARLPTNGIIAGCSQSNAFARAFLHHILEQI